jgi:hypothetical protein
VGEVALMPSVGLQEWLSVRGGRLDEIERAHRGLGGTGPGRRYTTQQINQAYAVLLSAQFQAFCRDLHTESVQALVPGVAVPGFHLALRTELFSNRKLDRGNPNPGNIGADFSRLGLTFWTEVEALDARNASRKALLEELNAWRNAIAHQDFDPAVLGATLTLTLAKVRGWRGACNGLADSFDEVMRRYILALTGSSPW